MRSRGGETRLARAQESRVRKGDDRDRMSIHRVASRSWSGKIWFQWSPHGRRWRAPDAGRVGGKNSNFGKGTTTKTNKEKGKRVGRHFFMLAVSRFTLAPVGRACGGMTESRLGKRNWSRRGRKSARIMRVKPTAAKELTADDGP